MLNTGHNACPLGSLNLIVTGKSKLTQGGFMKENKRKPIVSGNFAVSRWFANQHRLIFLKAALQSLSK